MSEQTRFTQLLGFLVPNENFTSDKLDTYSTATEQGPKPGVPTLSAGTTSDGVLEASGTSTETDYEVYCQEAGAPISATILTRPRLTPAQSWLGWNPPHVLREQSAPVLALPISWDTAADSSGRHYICTRTLTPGRYELSTWDQVYKHSPINPAMLVPYSASYPAGRQGPALCPMPNDRMLAFLMHAQEGAADGYLNVSAWECSTLSAALPGADRWSNNILPQALDNSGQNPARYGRIRARYSGGPKGLICMVIEKQLGATHAHAPNEWVLEQYVSDDFGATFREVDDWDVFTAAATTGFARLPDLCVLADGRIVLAYQKDDTADKDVCIRVIGGAFEKFRNAEEIVVFSGRTASEVTCWVDETGMRVMVASDATPTPERIDVKWADAALIKTWNDWRQGITCGGSSQVKFGGYFDQATGKNGSGLTIRHAADSAWMTGLTCNRAVPAINEWLSIVRLGGWHSPALPTAVDGLAMGRISFGQHYGALLDAHTLIAAHETGSNQLDPDSQGWTLVNTGWSSSAGSRSEGAVEWDFSGGAGQGRYYRDPVSPIAAGFPLAWQMRMISAGSVAAFNVGVLIRVGDGANDASFQLRYSSTQIRCYDVRGAATRFTVALDTTTWHLYKVAVYDVPAVGTVLKLWAFSDNSPLGVLLGAATATTGAAGAGLNRITVGHFAVTTDRSRWRWLGYVGGSATYATGSILYSQQNPASLSASSILDIPGRPIMPAPCWVDRGFMLRSPRGPHGHGDYWVSYADHDYPLAALSPRERRSPAEEWRGAAWVGAVPGPSMLIDYLNPDGAEQVGVSLAVLMHRTNVRSWTLEGRIAAGAWTVLATVDGCFGFGPLEYRRDGREVRQNAGAGVGNRYLKRNELVGGYCLLKSGQDTVWRPITHNTEGIWRNGFATYKTPTIRIGGGLGGLDASGNALYILPPSHLFVLHQRNPIVLYDQYAVRITAQTTYESYYRIGVMPLGALAIPGQPNARGRVIGDAPNYELAETTSGRRFVLSRGSTRRTVQLAWSDQIDMSEVNADLTPDMISLPSGGASPVATYRDVPYLLRGLMDELQGARYPVVYLPRIPTTGATFFTSNPEDFVYCSLTSPVSRTHPIGLEGSTETVTVEGATLEEEL